MERVRVVAARSQTQGERQVGWPDVDCVEAGHGADGIEVGEALLPQRQERLSIGVSYQESRSADSGRLAFHHFLPFRRANWR
jgi:hypothetical protein